MSSIIDLYIYEVKGPTYKMYPLQQQDKQYLDREFSFNKLSFKNEKNETNSSIIPFELIERNQLCKNLIEKKIGTFNQEQYNKILEQLKKQEEKKILSIFRKPNLTKIEERAKNIYHEKLKDKIIEYLGKECNTIIKEYNKIKEEYKNVNKEEKLKLLKIKIDEIKYLLFLARHAKYNNFIRTIGNDIFKANNEFQFSRNILKNYRNGSPETEIKNSLDNIPFLYKIYKTLPARLTSNKILTYNLTLTSELKSTIYDKMKDLFDENLKILQQYYKNFIQDIENKEKNINEKSEIIYVLNEKCNIILIGDNHGSFHSFFRIILRLYKKGIITESYKLKEDYKLILLGDVVDRGLYSIELLYILLNLMSNNNNENNLRVILIRGNHEEKETYERYGFSNEYKKKIGRDIEKNIENFLKYCPSAIILNHINTRYWLCHGGFDIKYTKFKIIKNKIESVSNLDSNLVFIFDIKGDMSQIRWNDFNGKENDSFNNRCGKNKTCGIYYIGNKTLFEFISYLGIDFIIRGHNDDDSNAMILKNNKGGRPFEYFILNSTYFMDLCILLKNVNIPFYYGTRDKSLKFINEILSINPKKFEKKSIKIGTDEIYPVLTISNNSDKDRQQYSDSYLILSNKNIENKIRSYNKVQNNSIEQNEQNTFIEQNEQNNIRQRIFSYNNVNKYL